VVFKLIGEALPAVDADADTLERLAARLSRIRCEVEGSPKPSSRLAPMRSTPPWRV
jgi:hypothetical protein